MQGRRPSFQTYCERVLRNKSVRSAKTVATARSCLKRLNRYLAEIPINRITDSVWLDYCVKRRKERPTARLYDDRKFLNMILRCAYHDRLINRWPKLTIVDQKNIAGREVTSFELALLYQHASPKLTLQMDIAVKMGLRLREMLGLRWDQFNWQAKSIKLEAKDTKTRRSRVVPINPDVWDRLRARYATLASYSPYVFPRNETPALPQENNVRAWRRVKRLAGVKCRWHDLRHTCATLMRRRGIDRGTTAKILGMSERVLTEVYDHLSEEDLAKVALKMSG
jgi:integrase